jgi:hypothetical protein
MCAACVVQGVGYVGGALTGLQVMGARAKAVRLRRERTGPSGGQSAGDSPGVADTDPASAPAPVSRRAPEPVGR